MARIILLVCIFLNLSLVAKCQIGPYQKRLALVIGNSRYSAGMELRNPVNDARAMESTLQSLGFDVLKHENLTLEGLKQAITEFGKRLKGYDVGLFYYAGHGIQYHGHNYMIPIETTLDSEDHVEIGCVPADKVLNYMNIAQAKVNLIILDACRNNPFERSWSRSAAGSGLAMMDAPRGTLIAYATAPGRTASDGEGENGLFTSAILRYIKDENLTIEQVFKRVRTEVEEKSNKRQSPWEATSLSGEDLYVAKGFSKLKKAGTFSQSGTIAESKLKEAEAFYKSGVQKFGLKLFNDALYDLSRSLELNPYSAETQYSMGRLHQELKMTDQALSDFTRTIAIKPEMGIAYVSRGTLFFSLKKFQSAADDFEVASRLAPKNADYRFSWGLSLYELKDFKQAIDVFTMALNLNPLQTNATLYRGLANFNLRKMGDAVADFEEVIKVQPENSRAVLYRALALAEIKPERAIEELSAVIKNNPEQPLAHCERGILHLKNHNLEQAADDLNQAIKIDNNMTRAIFWKGRWFYETQNPKEALYAMNACIQMDSTFAEAFAWRGFLQAFPEPVNDPLAEPVEKTDKREQEIQNMARLDLNYALEIQPENPDLLLLKSIFLIRSGDFPGAEKELISLLIVNPDHLEALILLGRLKYQSGEIPEASKILTKCINTWKNAEAYYWRGECSIKLNFFEQALSDFDNALAIQPSLNKAFFKKIEVLIRSGSPEKGFKEYEKALLEGKINRNEILLNRMEASLMTGQPALALEDGFKLFPRSYLDSKKSVQTKKTGRAAIFSTPDSGNSDFNLGPEMFANALFLVARAYKDLGQKSQALDALFLLQSLNPRNESYQNLLKEVKEMNR